jgi:nicotinate phosphoribosyltransferase
MDKDRATPAIDFGHELLLTDLYELSMTDAYLAAGMEGTAVFEFFVRKLPGNRAFLLAAGLEQAVQFLMAARCNPHLLGAAETAARLTPATRNFLEDFRFSGDVDAIAEGTPVFADEPLLRVTAPLPEAQIAETRLINFLHYQTLVASKAARLALAAEGAELVDFGLRRAHSGEAGLLAARAAVIGGFAASATVPAAALFGMSVTGTMAHSYVQAHGSDEAAFLAFARARPQQVVFLLDTYDTLAAARTVVKIAPQLRQEGISIRGVRLDSGDLASLASAVRAILDAGGLAAVRIIASGGIDEHLIARLVANGAPIDAYGVGTSLVTSEDAPALNCAYKLKAYEGRPLRKRSTGKAFWPGPTQVFRQYDGRGWLAADIIGRDGEGIGGEPLLKPVMRGGRLVADLPDLLAIRQHARNAIATLPAALRRLEPGAPFRPQISAALQTLAAEVDRQAGF